MSPRAVLSLFGMALAACGTTAPSPRPCPTQRVAGPQATAGPVTVSADSDQVHGGISAAFTISAMGPARYSAPCDGAVQLLVSDSADQHVDAVSSARSPAGSCGDVQLAPGQRTVYSVSWRPDPTLPPGPYTLTLLLGDQAGVSLTVTLDLATPDARPCR